MASSHRPTKQRQGQREPILLLPKPFVVTGLPYKRDESIREVTRRARLGANTWLTVTYIATHPDYPLPFGSDRGLLAWITTQAFSTGSVQFSAIADYLRTFHLDRGGKSYKLFRERFQRIANLAIRIEREEGKDRIVNRLFLVPNSYEPIELGRASTEAPNRKILTYHRYGFRLDQAFWSYLRENPVPVPLKVARAFHNSPRGWDFALLVLYRSFAAAKPTIIPWQAIIDHLGGVQRDPYRLKYQLEGDLKLLRKLSSKVVAEFLPGKQGLKLFSAGARRLVQGPHTAARMSPDTIDSTPLGTRR